MPLEILKAKFIIFLGQCFGRLVVAQNRQDQVGGSAQVAESLFLLFLEFEADLAGGYK